MKDISYWYWTKFFNNEQVKEIDDFVLLQDYEFENQEKYDDTAKQMEPIRCISWQKLKSNKFLDFALDEALNINSLHFGYDLFYPISNRDSLNYNVYNSNMKASYNWHRDLCFNKLYDQKLTLLINLSTTPYTGGEFEIQQGDNIAGKEFSGPGDMILFKASEYHRVKPVLSGVRKTLALFFKGPNFR